MFSKPMRSYVRVLIGLGLTSVILYFAHLIIGHIVSPGYNMVTTDISSLTADGAPAAMALRIITTIYGVCFVGFSVGMVLVSRKRHGYLVRVGYMALLFLALVTTVGYGLFPLPVDKTTPSLQGTAHLIVTGLVVVSTLAALYLLALGYLRQENMKRLGRPILVGAIIITLAGPLSPLAIAFDVDILGLTERIVVYTLHAIIAMISYYYLAHQNK